MLPAVPGPHRIRRTVKLAAAVCGIAAIATACAPASNPPTQPVNFDSPLVTQIVATGNDAGREASVAMAKDGTPNVSYLLLTPTLPKGSNPPAVVPNTPQPPAVVVATFLSDKGYWSRTSASTQDYTKGVGTDTSIADKDGKYVPGVNTAIAVDGQGKAHVIWATPSGVFYTDDAQGGAYADPEQVTKDAATGGSIVVDDAGTPWIAYYDGGAVTIATKANGAWTTQTIAQTTSCSSCPPERTSIRLADGSTPIVAYTDGTSAIVRSVKGKALMKSTLGPGGFGISLALGKDGTGYAAYYTKDGSVNLAASSGPAASASSWGTKPLSTTSGASPKAATTGWSAGIDVDDGGKVYVTWVDPVANDVKASSGSPGSQLQAETVPQSAGGQNPAIAVSGDGKSLALPFYDAPNHQLAVATPSLGGVGLGVPSPTPSPPPTAPAGPACSPTSGTTALSIAAPVGAAASGFGTTCLAVVPNTAFSVAFDNKDTAGTPHNWALYKDPAYATLIGGATSSSDIVTAPGSATYKVNALAPGTYYFRCDVHPTTMTGELIVAKAGASPQPGPTSSP
jgi:plastocyanin